VLPLIFFFKAATLDEQTISVGSAIAADRLHLPGANEAAEQ
jgi:hypothetical protein